MEYVSIKIAARARIWGMRLQVSINDGLPVRASLQGQGWLSVHLNLSSGDAEDGSSRLWVQAIDKTDEPNSIISTWDIGNPAVGDTASIRVLSDGEADPPNEVKQTSECRTIFSQIWTKHGNCFRRSARVTRNSWRSLNGAKLLSLMMSSTKSRER